MLTLTTDEERFIAAYRETKKKRDGYMSESDIQDWIEEYWRNIVNLLDSERGTSGSEGVLQRMPVYRNGFYVSV